MSGGGTISDSDTLVQGSTTSGQPGDLIMGACTTAAPTYATGTTNPVSLTTAGAVRTDSSAVTQPVSGTVAATQSGTWTVQPGNTANTTAWKVDGSAVTQPVSGTFWQATQPVSAASLPLPSGASTSSLQTSGNASLSSLDTKVPSLGQALAAASVPVVLTAAQIATLTPLTTVTVTQATGTNLHTTVDNFPATQPISAVSLPLPSGASTSALQTAGNSTLSSIDAGIPAALGQTTMASSMSVVIANDQTAVPVSGSVSPAYGTVAAYSAVANAFVTAASATDVFVIKGSATKTVKISLLSISGTTTAGSGVALNASLIKRSTANTGGTSVALTAVPHDSNDAAATAVVTEYTANPTVLGTAVGTVRGIRQTIATAGTVNNVTVWDFGAKPAKPVTLRNANEYLAVNFGATTITGPVITIYIEWTEE